MVLRDVWTLHGHMFCFDDIVYSRMMSEAMGIYVTRALRYAPGMPRDATLLLRRRFYGIYWRLYRVIIIDCLYLSPLPRYRLSLRSSSHHTTSHHRSHTPRHTCHCRMRLIIMARYASIGNIGGDDDISHVEWRRVGYTVNFGHTRVSQVRAHVTSDAVIISLVYHISHWRSTTVTKWSAAATRLSRGGE